MAKTKPPRESAFGDEEEPARIPYIPVSGINPIYETGFAGLSTLAFEDPIEKENEQLKGQLAELQAQLQSRTSDLLVQDGTLVVHDFQLTPTGLIAPETFSEDSWQQLGLLLFKLEGSIQWLIGDWIVYGDQVGWGDLPKLAAVLGRDYGTLRNYATISRSVKLSFRNDNLTYTHHVVVAHLDSNEQKIALAYAVERGLSVAQFRAWLKEQQGTLPERTTTSPADSSYTALKKLSKRNPSTFKPQEREEARLYVLEVRRWLDEVWVNWELE